MKKLPVFLVLMFTIFVNSNIFSQGNCFNCGNSYLSSSGPDIDYDNIVSAFHSTIARQADKTVLIWGEDTKSNGTTNWLIPAEINSTNYPGLTGTILRFAAGSNSGSASHEVQFALLTSDGLWAWGAEGRLVDASLTTSTSFQKIFTPGQLPVAPENVKMLFGTYQTLAILSCAGEVWVLSQHSDMRGDGGSGSSTAWSKVQYDNNDGNPANDGTLSGINAVRGCPTGLMALKSNGEVWTWGDEVYLGDGSNQNDRSRARKMDLTKPQGGGNIAPKMIGMTGSRDDNGRTSHYILGTDGFVYSLGNNDKRQLGDITTTERQSWVRVLSAANTPLSNVVWISPNEHDNYGNFAVNALTSAASQNLWSWGDNERNMIGGSNDGTDYNPFNTQGGIGATDQLYATETGGHTSMVIKKCSPNFGYVGHRINGSMADGVEASAQETTYNFSGTATLDICGAASGAANLPQPNPLTPPKYNVGEVYTLNPTPAGGTLSVTGPASLSGNQLTITGTGSNITVTYSNAPGTCAPDDFTIKAEDLELPVVFGPINASMSGNVLRVNWSTNKETNNDHFEIEASSDGKTFTKIGDVQTQAKDGNSDLSLKYTFEKNGAELALGISLLILGLMLPFGRRYRWLISTVGVAVILLFGYSCTKNDKALIQEDESSLYIRITQVDKDGTKAYSQVVKVVKQ